MMRTQITGQRLNLRERFGVAPLPIETPWSYRLIERTRRSFLASPVPVPNVASPWHIYLDLSKWNWPIDLSVAYGRGVRAVWLKQGQGAWPDSKFDELVAAAQAAQMEIGFYHFADPTQTSVTSEQAASLAYDMTRGVGNFSMWLDVERNGPLNPYRLLDFCIRWVETYAGLSNRKVEIYTRPSWFNQFVERSSFWVENKIDLVAARYNLQLASPWSDGNYLPLDWNYAGVEFNKWQYDDSNGLGEYFGADPSAAHSVDLNVFPGSFEDLQADQAGDVPVDPPSEIPINPYTKFMVQSETLNCRNFPTTAPTFNGEPVVVLKKAKKGDVVTLAAEIQNVYAPGLYNEVWCKCVLPDGETVGWLAIVHPNYPYLKTVN